MVKLNLNINFMHFNYYFFHKKLKVNLIIFIEKIASGVLGQAVAEGRARPCVDVIAQLGCRPRRR
jgi:hypothetical protein